MSECFKALLESACCHDHRRSDGHVYGRKGQGLHLPIPGPGSQASRCRNVQGYDRHATLKGNVKDPLLQCSGRSTRSVRSDEGRVPTLEVGHEFVCRSASVMPRRAENQSLHTEQIQKHGDRLRIPGRMLQPGVRPLPKIGRKTRHPPLERQGARLVPLAKNVVRVGREVLCARYPNVYRQT